MKKLSFLLIFLISTSLLSAQDITGKWQGLLKVPGAELTIVFNINKEDSGYTATMDSPDQGAFSLAVQEVNFADRKLKLKATAPAIEYEGVLNDKNEFEGTFRQSGYEFPLDLSQKEVQKSNIKKPQEPEKPYPYIAEEVKFKNKKDNITLVGTLTKPKDGASFPAVVLISGSGPQDRDETLLGHKPFLIISDYLTRQGISVLRYDDRGTADSEGDFSKATTADFVNDVEAAFDFLKARKDINTDQIGLIGHSEGGIIAPMLAAKNKEVAFIVLLAGTGIRGDQLLLKQSYLIGESAGLSESELSIAQSFNKGAFEIIVNAENENDLKEDLEQYLKNSVNQYPSIVERSGLNKEAFINQQLQQLTNPWMMYFLKYDPALALQQVDCPVLAIIGGKDLQVPAKVNLNAIEEALKVGGNDQYTMKEFEGLNHLFQEADTGSPSEYAQIKQTFSPKALEFLKNWLLEQVK